MINMILSLLAYLVSLDFYFIKMFEAIIYLLQGKTEENEKYKQ